MLDVTTINVYYSCINMYLYIPHIGISEISTYYRYFLPLTPVVHLGFDT
jgi:hypothetical protein